jgi:hypothetical protein
MSNSLATGLVNWNELWKIILAAVIGGTGVAIVFGFLLLGLSRAKTATRPASRYLLYALSGLCGGAVVAVAAVGIYAMTQKPSAPQPKPRPITSVRATPIRGL